MKMKMKMNTRSNRYGINRHRSRNSQKYAKYKICLNIIVLICIKKYLRRGYGVSKRLVKLTRFQGFFLQLPGYQDLPPLSFVLSYQL